MCGFVTDLALTFAFFVSAWNNTPTVAMIETSSYPIEKVVFPAVTLCAENSSPNRWGPTIKVLDFLKRRCQNMSRLR